MCRFPHKLRLPDCKLQFPNALPQTAARNCDSPRLAEKTPPQSLRNGDSLFPYFLDAVGKMRKRRAGITTRIGRNTEDAEMYGGGMTMRLNPYRYPYSS